MIRCSAAAVLAAAVLAAAGRAWWRDGHAPTPAPVVRRFGELRSRVWMQLQ